MSFNLYHVVKSPSNAMALSNLAYFAPGTFSEDVKNVKISGNNFTSLVFGVGESDSVNKHEVALNGAARNTIKNCVVTHVTAVPIVIDQVAACVILNIEYWKKGMSSIKDICPLKYEDMETALLTQFNNMTFNKTQIICFNVNVASNVDITFTYEITFQNIMSDSFDDLPYAQVVLGKTKVVFNHNNLFAN